MIFQFKMTCFEENSLMKIGFIVLQMSSICIIKGKEGRGSSELKSAPNLLWQYIMEPLWYLALNADAHVHKRVKAQLTNTMKIRLTLWTREAEEPPHLFSWPLTTTDVPVGYWEIVRTANRRVNRTVDNGK